MNFVKNKCSNDSIYLLTIGSICILLNANYVSAHQTCQQIFTNTNQEYTQHEIQSFAKTLANFELSFTTDPLFQTNGIYRSEMLNKFKSEYKMFIDSGITNAEAIYLEQREQIKLSLSDKIKIQKKLEQRKRNLIHEQNQIILNPKEIKIFQQPAEVLSLAVSKDGKTLYAGVTARFTGEGKLRILDIESGTLIQNVDHKGWVQGVYLSSDEKNIFTIAGKYSQWFELATHSEMKQTVEHSATINSLALSHDGNSFFTGGDDKILKFIHIPTGIIRNQIQMNGMINDLIISPDGNYLYTADKVDGISIIDLTTEEVIDKIGVSNSLKRLAINKDGTLLFAGSKFETRIIKIATKTTLFQIPQTSTIDALALSPDGLFLYTGASNGNVQIIEVSSGKVLFTLNHNIPINALAVSPSGKYLFIGTGGTSQVRDYKVRMVDLFFQQQDQ